MSLHTSSGFQIYRLDDPELPDDHYRAFWRIDGRTFRVQVWGPLQWDGMLDLDRPRDAIRLKGGVWMTLRPMDVSWDEEEQLVADHLASSPFIGQGR
jgi:hypothetical protein